MLGLRRCNKLLSRVGSTLKPNRWPNDCVFSGGLRALSGGVRLEQGSFPTWELFITPWQSVGFAGRALASSTNPVQGDQTTENKKGRDALMIDEDDFDAITDKIPQKPMTAAEGVSYTAIILAAFGVLAAIAWAFISNYILDPVEYVCFNLTLDKLRHDPRITVRLGETIKGYGGNSHQRWQRTQIPHKMYKDGSGVQHLQIQFHIKGKGGLGIVYADMSQDKQKEWQYSYLYVDFQQGGTSQRVVIVRPQI